MFRLRTAQLLRLATVAIFALRRDDPVPLSLQPATVHPAQEILRLIVLSITLPSFALMGGYVKPFDLQGCIEDASELVAPQAAAKNLHLSCQIAPAVPPVVISDITRLRQILVNLLSNAVTFTRAGEVAVHVVSAVRGPSDISKSNSRCRTPGSAFPPTRWTGCFTDRR